jgi:hypothetical protein
LRDVAVRRLIDADRHFRGAYCLHQGDCRHNTAILLLLMCSEPPKLKDTPYLKA